jgi:hypothetical protein
MMPALRLDWTQYAQSDWTREALKLRGNSEQSLASPAMNPPLQPPASELVPRSAAAAAAVAAAAAAAAAAAGTVFRRHYSREPLEEASTSCAES